MTISGKVVYLFETMLFLSFIQEQVRNTHAFSSFVWQSLSEMVTHGEPMLTFLPRHREFRILMFSEYHCCPATKSRTIDTLHNRQSQLVNNPG